VKTVRLIRLSEDYIGEVIAGQIGLRGPKLPSCALTLGSFDGLHRGHMELLNKVGQARDRHGLAAGAVFTFMQHPRLLLDSDDSSFLLTTWREKLSLFEELGCQVIVAVDFCPALARLEYRDFVELFLVRYLGMKHLVAGHDVHLGAKRRGTADSLATLGQELGYGMEVVAPVREGEDIISSSNIRRAVTAGDMPRATAMLGRHYALWGEVVPGDGRGRRIGFPTANIQSLDSRKLLPEPGVYAVRVQVPGDVVTAACSGALATVSESLPEVDLQGELLSSAASDWVVFPGMLNFGRVPTFHHLGLGEPRIEAHLMGFKGDLRGRNVKVEWVGRLRGEQKFAGAEELVAQLERDRSETLRVLGV
jgi:riboflavin kinase/FMN adenylyltransferase